LALNKFLQKVCGLSIWVCLAFSISNWHGHYFFLYSKRCVSSKVMSCDYDIFNPRLTEIWREWPAILYQSYITWSTAYDYEEWTSFWCILNYRFPFDLTVYTLCSFSNV
jgi:hypothetical protein